MVQGRRMLLGYTRENSRARRAFIFTLDTERQAFVLSEYSEASTLSLHPPLPAELSLHGLFASALSAQGFLDVPDIADNVLSLPEERALAGVSGHVVLHALREGSQARAVLVLCFGLEDTVQLADDLPICIALLSAYLSEQTDVAGTPTVCLRPDADQAPDRHTVGVPATSGDMTRESKQTIIDQERSRIAREIHDGPAQNIAHVIHRLEYARRIFDEQPRQALSEVNHARDVLVESLEDLRRGIASLIPAPLEEQDFATALEMLLQEYSMDGLQIAYDANDVVCWPRSLQAPVYRFLQEALNNVRKHAQATRVNVSLRAFSNFAVVQVSDNGKGFVMEWVNNSVPVLAASGKGARSNKKGEGGEERKGDREAHQLVTSGLGLRAMEERVRQAGGFLEISSRPGAGTILKARFPLAEPPGILTSREREVLALLVDGATNRAIAAKLSISIETVKSHVHHIIQKMQVKDRTQAAVMATRQQWLWRNERT